VPFLRPAELAQDASEDWPVFVHALDWLEREEGWQPELIVNLRPTSPLRRPEHVDGAIRLLLETGSDSVKAVCLGAPASAQDVAARCRRVYRAVSEDAHAPGTRTRRTTRQLEDVYWQKRRGRRYAPLGDLRTAVMIGRRVAGLITETTDSIDIDTPLDLALAELLLAQRH